MYKYLKENVNTVMREINNAKKMELTEIKIN